MSGIPTDPQLRGVIPNSFQHVFDRITTTTTETTAQTLLMTIPNTIRPI